MSNSDDLTLQKVTLKQEWDTVHSIGKHRKPKRPILPTGLDFENHVPPRTSDVLFSFKASFDILPLVEEQSLQNCVILLPLF